MGNKNFQNGFALGYALRERESAGYAENYIKINKYTTGLQAAFRNAELPEELTLDLSDAQVTTLQQAFQSSTYQRDLIKLTIIGDTSTVTNFSYFVYGRALVTTIDGDIDFTAAANVGNMFTGTKIANAAFIPNTLTVNFDISNLSTPSDDMLISIANCLSNTTRATLSLSGTSYEAVSAIYGTVDTDTMIFTRTDDPTDVPLVDFISAVDAQSQPIYKGWQLTHS